MLLQKSYECIVQYLDNKDLCALRCCSKYYQSFMQDYEARAYNVESFIQKFLELSEYLWFRRHQECLGTLVSGSFVKTFINRGLAGDYIDVFSYLMFSIELVQWLLRIGYTYEGSDTLEEAIRSVEVQFVGSGRPSVQERMWLLSRRSLSGGNRFSHIIVIGCWDSPLADILLYCPSMDRLNIMTHSCIYALYPLAAIGRSRSLPIRPYKYHREAKCIRESIRDAAKKGMKSPLPSTKTGSSFNDALSFLSPRLFSDKFTWILKLRNGATDLLDILSLNSFRVTYGANWITLAFHLYMPPGDAFHHCVSYDVYADLLNSSNELRAGDLFW
ncbi:hypothetical protein GYMLUDRAFT_57622 [Collybiopsis luxurians FD-317 M1]|uniref:Unplaced genomic scaffold GYMLUscaffold_16, whole genome shotgun sequence n=1 Tax=Collybiopsis luxurians FD-317 M1 TaxID=944289 RepID=A0A0D0D2H5_9AGAR|nr:hypothetical protein GYMLUDRAFT_57622 [Collybiopsis luxurians FD-317 M1]